MNRQVVERDLLLACGSARTTRTKTERKRTAWYKVMVIVVVVWMIVRLDEMVALSK